jgi:hypothetical protein
VARCCQGFQKRPQKVADVIYKFYADKGYNLSLDTFAKALSRVEVNPGFRRSAALHAGAGADPVAG